VIVEAAGSRSVRDARVVMGAVAPIPWRSPQAEAALRGGPLDVARAKTAAEAALKDAQPLSDNGYKVTVAKVMVRRAILRAAGVAEA
jgi:xanthine dehydrogenase YagS FAD-binding subunit